MSDKAVALMVTWLLTLLIVASVVAIIVGCASAVTVDTVERLTVDAESSDDGYDREDYDPSSGICEGMSGTLDPYTGTEIDKCAVDHVVALKEAHESGAYDWDDDRRQRFNNDPRNLVASRSCVNSSKSDRDIAEWSDEWIARSSACGGGYSVTAEGRCFFAQTTVAVKGTWGLSVDEAEQAALVAALADCE